MAENRRNQSGHKTTETTLLANRVCLFLLAKWRASCIILNSGVALEHDAADEMMRHKMLKCWTPRSAAAAERKQVTLSHIQTAINVQLSEKSPLHT
jgi:hypothetical protein